MLKVMSCYQNIDILLVEPLSNLSILLYMVFFGVSSPPLENLPSPGHTSHQPFQATRFFPQSQFSLFSQNSEGWEKLYQNPYIQWGGKTCGYVYGYEYY